MRRAWIWPGPRRGSGAFLLIGVGGIVGRAIDVEHFVQLDGEPRQDDRCRALAAPEHAVFDVPATIQP